MGYIELAPEDREKYGAPERIPFTYGRWGLRSIDALEEQVGWTLEDLGNALRRKALDDAGNPIREPVLDDEGKPVLDDAGNPEYFDLYKPRKEAMAAVIWLALRSIGIRVPWDEFEVYAEARINWGDETEGKAESPAPEV